jgi:hypothetical protein
MYGIILLLVLAARTLGTLLRRNDPLTLLDREKTNVARSSPVRAPRRDITVTNSPELPSNACSWVDPTYGYVACGFFVVYFNDRRDPGQFLLIGQGAPGQSARVHRYAVDCADGTDHWESVTSFLPWVLSIHSGNICKFNRNRYDEFDNTVCNITLADS